MCSIDFVSWLTLATCPSLLLAKCMLGQDPAPHHPEKGKQNGQMDGESISSLTVALELLNVKQVWAELKYQIIILL